jgi:hypothetical protein
MHLNACARLKKLTISALCSMPLLEDLNLCNYVDEVSIKDLSPLIHCKRLGVLDTGGNEKIATLSPCPVHSTGEAFDC